MPDTLESMNGYNKAGLAGAGAAACEIVVWLIEDFARVDVPESVEGALVVICAALLTALGPANK